MSCQNEYSPDFLQREFRCMRCGNCCRKHGTVRLTNTEIIQIAAFLELDVYQFTEKYTALLPDRTGLTIAEHENGDCIFYTEAGGGGCLIQPVKPKQCRDFPFFWRFPGWDDVCEGGRRLKNLKDRDIV